MLKKAISILLLISTYIAAGFSQYESVSGYYEKGKVLEGLSMNSELLGYDVNYAVYLPPGYAESQRFYPVVYLLHGFTDNETAWIQFGEVHLSADRAIADRKIPPMIIVMPDANVTWYINDYQHKNPYESMIFEEFIPYIDRTYKTRPEKEFRAVAGLSMGGYGSLIWSLHHPEMFSACAAFSAGVFTDIEMKEMKEEEYDNLFHEIYGPENMQDRLTKHWKNNSVIELMSTLKIQEIEKVRYYIDCGDDDFLFRGNSTLHITMRERGIDHEYRIREGKHEWIYWRTYITTGLEFIGKSFQR
ncbi:MAG: alpha/beta hydrolase [Bacteroidales bacterium]